MIQATQSRDPSTLIITVVGFATTVGQILLLRELLVLFYGNEMSAGLLLAGWLLWTSLGSALAARSAGGRPPTLNTLATLLSLLALALPALVLLVRGARWVFAVPIGELATVGTMVLVCLAAPSLFCAVAGALFGLCWSWRSARAAAGSLTRPLVIYLGEALGAAVGGIAFFFVLQRSTTALATSFVVAFVPLAVSGWIVWRYCSGATAASARAVWAIAAIGTVAVALLGGELDKASRVWRWGDEFVAARDTPFQHIVVLKQADQVTVFSSGLWLFTHPDPATTELAVDLALLQHRRPRRLLFLGGGIAGYVEEALKHPEIEIIDYVEQDPELIPFVEGFLSPGARDSLRDPRVHIYREDAGSFLRRRDGEYDVVFLNVGDPINAQMNRFYTVEIFRHIERHLLPGGLLTLSMPGGGDVVGPIHARFLGSMKKTLGQVFSQVAVLPGERARFLAAGVTAPFELDGAVLAQRISERRLDLVHLREDTLLDLMNPLRLDYLESVLDESADSPINRQFSPVCYYHGLMLWAAQWHPALARLVGRAATARPLHLAAGVALVGVLAVLGFWLGRPRYRLAIAVSVLVQGATAMVLQVVLILTFQILQGFAYLQLALIIALFMAGLAVGTLLVAVMRPRWGDSSRAIRWFAGLQAAVSVYPLLLLLFLSPVCGTLREAFGPTSAASLFSAASLMAGILAGAHFSLAVLASTAAGARLERTGGYLYAVDLAGAAGGAFAAGLFLLPVYGVRSSLALLVLLSLFCLVAILRQPGWR